MLHTLLKSVDSLLPVSTARAHCDIPCRIYDPATALIAALSVIRLIDIMKETEETDDGPSLARTNTLVRCVQRKEEEAERVKHEIRIIWGDYFKVPHINAHPIINNLTHQIMMTASTCKQEANRDDAEALLELVNQFAEIFWETKGITTDRRTAPYPPARPVVYPQL
tara:strand:+ start:324 stop:824 length:501 start_codon:yes stop_codon:yes gene_type:complete